MSKILKNTTGAAILISDMGIRLPQSPATYTIPPQDYPLWASSVSIVSPVTSGSVVVNNGLADLLVADGLDHLALKFDRFDNVTYSSLSPRLTTVTTTPAGTLVLTNASNFSNTFSGSASGYKVQLPNATTLKLPANGALKYEFFNQNASPITITYNNTTTLYQIASNAYVTVTLKDNSTSNGVWLIVITDLIDITNPDFAGVKDGFEDFMFDAYAGNGGNDNQYAFTAVANLGSSDIDGAITVVGNDYEGIHSLSTLVSARSRPLVASFNNINRIKLGAQPESLEVRVRIETLATVTEKFTARYGLMDDSLIGQPANAIHFSYDPVYPVTPQFQVVTVTPNSFPVATFQVASVTWTRTNSTLYQVTINGTTVSYTSDATATDAEISAGLSSAINGNGTLAPLVTATNAKPMIVTSDILGTAFTITGANTTPTITTANVAIAVYSQTINGTTYNFTSDGTPTATEVCNGLRALINADGPLPVTATGTTTLILTADVISVAFTYSGTANLTQVLTQAAVTQVLYSGNWLANVTVGSTVTSLNTGVPVVAGQWYRLKAVVSADGSNTFIYIDSLFIDKITTPIPIVGMRFVFKLEKTLGTTPRTTSIDYITWRRTRG